MKRIWIAIIGVAALAFTLTTNAGGYHGGGCGGGYHGGGGCYGGGYRGGGYYGGGCYGGGWGWGIGVGFSGCGWGVSVGLGGPGCYGGYGYYGYAPAYAAPSACQAAGNCSGAYWDFALENNANLGGALTSGGSAQIGIDTGVGGDVTTLTWKSGDKSIVVMFVNNKVVQKNMSNL